MWKRVTPPPPGFVEVVRQTCDNGLYVLVLIKKGWFGYSVLSVVDHKTLLNSITQEGRVKSLADAKTLMEITCTRWTNSEYMRMEPVPEKLFRVMDNAGKFSDPMTRDKLFEMLSNGTITWGDEVWKDSEGMASLSGWRPIMQVLGFPNPWSLWSSSTRWPNP